MKPKAMAATMNLLRQTGVLLASKGLDESWTLRLMGEPLSQKPLRPGWTHTG